MSSTSSSRMSSKVKKILKRIGIGLAVTVIVLVVAVEVLLQTGALTGLVRNIASDYVDGRLQVERISGSIITHFPKVRLVLEEVSVTYPHDKFAYARGITPDLRYTEEGRGAGADTLLSFSNLDLTMSWIDAIGGEITLKKLALDSPRFFFHDYGRSPRSRKKNPKRKKRPKRPRRRTIPSSRSISAMSPSPAAPISCIHPPRTAPTCG